MNLIKQRVFHFSLLLTVLALPTALFAATDQFEFSINNATDVASATANFSDGSQTTVNLRPLEHQVVGLQSGKTLNSVYYTAASTKLRIPCSKLKATGKNYNNVRFVAWLVNAVAPYQECHYWDYHAK